MALSYCKLVYQLVADRDWVLKELENNETLIAVLNDILYTKNV